MSHSDTPDPVDIPSDAVSGALAWANLMVERDLTPGEREHFGKWLSDADHEREFFRVVDIPFLLTLVPQSQQAAILSQAQTKIVPSPARRSWFSIRVFAVCAAVVLVGLALYWLAPAKTHVRYTTQVGDKREIAFPDGSHAELNSRTTIEWLGQRRVRLLNGEAFFNVTPDPKHPFMVLTDRGSVEVLGTEFDLYRRDDSAEQISVLAGRVRITGPQSQSTPEWTLELTSGQQSTWEAGQAPTTSRLKDPSKAVAWRDDRLEFEDEPLEEVVRELRRYTEIDIEIVDPEIRKIHVTGTLPVDRNHIRESILRLGKWPDIRVVAHDHSILLSHRALTSMQQHGAP